MFFFACVLKYIWYSHTVCMITQCFFSIIIMSSAPLLTNHVWLHTNTNRVVNQSDQFPIIPGQGIVQFNEFSSESDSLDKIPNSNTTIWSLYYPSPSCLIHSLEPLNTFLGFHPVNIYYRSSFVYCHSRRRELGIHWTSFAVCTIISRFSSSSF